MQVSGRGHQIPLVKTGESIVGPETGNRGSFHMCDEYLPQFKLGPLITDRYHCKGDISQREVSYSTPVRYDNSLPNKKNIRAHSVQKYLGGG